MQRSRVDLPHPLWPARRTTSPSAISRLTSRTAGLCESGYRKERSSIETRMFFSPVPVVVLKAKSLVWPLSTCLGLEGTSRRTPHILLGGLASSRPVTAITIFLVTTKFLLKSAVPG